MTYKIVNSRIFSLPLKKKKRMVKINFLLLTLYLLTY